MKRFRRNLSIVVGMAAVVLCILIALARVWLLTDLPSTSLLPVGTVAPSTILYDRYGRVLYEIMDPHVGRQQPLALADIPLYLQQATIATEDASFYSNPGVDVRGILRAVWINLRGGEVLAGGSTITQQLARNLLLTPQERSQRTLLRKLRESILAYRLARAYSKERILELYLNQTCYGNMAYGVEAAAHIYFGKSARELDLAECALLAGLPQAPSAYNPLIDPQAARDRQAVVLALMVKHGYIGAEQAKAAHEEPLAYAATSFPIRAPHFVMYVWDILRSEYGEEALYRQGLRVYTTLDVDLQERARDIARYHLQELATSSVDHPAHNVTDAALVALDPQTGEILAMLGSPDYFQTAIDGAVNVTLMPRQPGSAIKPLTYATAFTRDYTPATMLLDVRMSFITREGNAYVPVNYDRKFRGPVLLREALASSLNVVAVQVLQHVGVEALLSTAHNLGISTLQESQRYGLALTLGGGEVRLLELTAAYASLANGGWRVEPTAILRVEDAQGKTLWTRQTALGSRVIDERVAYLVTDILSDDSARIPAFGEGSALQLSRPAAAKTGTTTDWRDNWTVGYTPDLAVGVWAGNANNSPMIDVTGITGAAPIWHSFMEEALKGKPVRTFTRPDGLLRLEICADSGLLPNSYCPHRRSEWFIAGSEPHALCDMHILAQVDQRSGELAGEHTPAEFRVQRVATLLPAAAQAWAEEQHQASGALYLTTAPTTAAQIPSPAGAAGIALSRPDPNTTYRIAANVPLTNQRIEVTAVPSALGTPLHVELLADAQVIATLEQSPYTTLWQLQAGVHAFSAQVTDSAGQRWSSPVITITVLP